MCRKMETTRPEANNNNGSDNRDSESRFQILLQAMRVQQESQTQLFESQVQILEGLQRQRQATSTIPTELEQLEQGDMSVAEYFWKFIRLFDSIDSEVTKIRCFVKGLESSVQHDVASVNPQTFNDAIRRAVWSEVENENCAKVSKKLLNQ